MIASLIASIVIGTNSVSFTATATGVAKETPVEFMFVGKGSDRDYEAMFILDEPIAALADALEKSGIPRGCPTDLSVCRLWSVGVPLTLSPALDDYVERQPIEGESYPPIVYTGGARADDGKPMAEKEMPQAVLALFDCAQSILHYDGILPQGVVYGKQLARQELKKGDRRTFKLAWDGRNRVRSINLEITPGNLAQAIRRLRDESASGPLDVTV